MLIKRANKWRQFHFKWRKLTVTAWQEGFNTDRFTAYSGKLKISHIFSKEEIYWMTKGRFRKQKKAK